jgi:hypothetical protein
VVGITEPCRADGVYSAKVPKAGIKAGQGASSERRCCSVPAARRGGFSLPIASWQASVSDHRDQAAIQDNLVDGPSHSRARLAHIRKYICWLGCTASGFDLLTLAAHGSEGHHPSSGAGQCRQCMAGQGDDLNGFLASTVSTLASKTARACSSVSVNVTRSPQRTAASRKTWTRRSPGPYIDVMLPPRNGRLISPSQGTVYSTLRSLIRHSVEVTATEGPYTRAAMRFTPATVT